MEINSRRGKRYCTKRVTNEKTPPKGHFRIEKDTRDGVMYAPFACVLVAQRRGFEPPYVFLRNTISSRAHSTTLPPLQQAITVYNNYD